MKTQQKQKIKRALAKVFSPYFQAFKIVDRVPRFIILMYHSVNADHQLAVHPDEFEKQIEFLTSNYRVVPLENFLNYEKDSFAITFDDGYQDNFHYALPILKNYKCPATFFICTGFINREIGIPKKWKWAQGLKFLTAEQIKEMKKRGMDFGCHTHTHPILSKILLEEAKREIHKSKIILEDILEEEVKSFAYPYGQINDFNKHTISILKQEGFQLACSTIWGSNSKNTNSFILHRIRIDPEDTFEDFKSKTKENWNFIKWFHVSKVFLRYKIS